MTVDEINNEFDLLYNNLSSGAAPPLDKYEKSIFLTKAQEELVLAYYNGHNTYYNSFEETEENRHYFSNLVKEITFSDTQLHHGNKFGFSRSYVKNSDLPVTSFTASTATDPATYNGGFWFPVEEFVEYGKRDNDTVVPLDCDKSKDYGKMITVAPIKLDDFNRIIQNPFKRPSVRKVVRINVNDCYVVYSPLDRPIYSYTIRYICKPTPIILEDWSSSSGPLEMIDMAYQPIVDTNGEYIPIPDALIRKIINRAVELAKASYVGDLNEMLALNQRSQ